MLKRLINVPLRTLNLELRSLTEERAERRRLNELDRRGRFTQPQFPLDGRLRSTMADSVIAFCDHNAAEFTTWSDPDGNRVGFTLQNDYFSSPDAEVLYAMVRLLRPRRIIEIGSGNSSRILRLALLDGGLQSTLSCVDPSPRTPLHTVADEIIVQRAESVDVSFFTENLQPGDFLCIDSSHEVKVGSDTPFLYLEVLPRLAPGVVIHVHDIFLPWEYPREWIVENGWPWNEQYLVAAIVMFGQDVEVLWAGHHLQKTMPDFSGHFPRGVASSFWFRMATFGVATS